MGQQGPFYIFAAFVFTYGTTVLHSSRNLLLPAVMCSAAMIAHLDVGMSSWQSASGCNHRREFSRVRTRGEITRARLSLRALVSINLSS
jgi:hypothetical protein